MSNQPFLPRDRGLTFVVGLMAVIAIANLSLDIFSPRTIATISQVEYQLPKARNDNESSTRASKIAASKSADERLADYTFWLTVVTAILAASTIGLWIVTWLTLRHSETSSERQLRAYVGLKTLEWHPVGPDHSTTIESWNLQLVWQNSGFTPAKRCIVRTAWKDFPDVIPDNFDFPNGPLPIGDPTHISPGNTLHGSIDFPAGLLKRAELGQLSIYVWAWIEYSDIFKGTSRHRTEKCFLLRPIGDPTLDGSHIDTVSRTRFNGIDEDCFCSPIT